MGKRRAVRQQLVDRFVENANRATATNAEVIAEPNQAQLRRFLKMVESRKRQILDRILTEEP